MCLFAKPQKLSQIHRDHIRSIVGLRCYRRVTTFATMIITIALLYFGFHVVQTGRFLIGHFVQTADVRDTIQLDLKLWHKNHGNNASGSKIPRHIHQIWLSTRDDKEMLERFRKASNSCIHLHSNYSYTLWTHTKIVALLSNEYQWILPLYKSYRYDMQRIDAMKYLLLFHFGGVYIDLDIRCLVSDIIPALLPIAGIKNEPDIILHLGAEGFSPNTDILAAKKNHPLLKLAVNRLEPANRWFYLYHLTIILSAGPTYFYGIFKKYPFKDHIYFVPNDLLWGKLVDSVGGATWYGRDTLILSFIEKYKFTFSYILLLSLVVFMCQFKTLKRRP